LSLIEENAQTRNGYEKQNKTKYGSFLLPILKFKEQPFSNSILGEKNFVFYL
jgi:hypothetical protein